MLSTSLLPVPKTVLAPQYSDDVPTPYDTLPPSILVIPDDCKVARQQCRGQWLDSLRGLTPEWFCGFALRLNPRAGASRNCWWPTEAKSQIHRIQALVDEACQAGCHPRHLHIFIPVTIIMQRTSEVQSPFH